MDRLQPVGTFKYLRLPPDLFRFTSPDSWPILSPMISRREFALLTAGLAAPGRVLGGGKRRSASAADRKFLFLFNDGGWDTGYAFTDFSTVIDAGLEEGAEGASVG